MNKILLSAALFIAQSTAIQVSQALQKSRAESAWRQEVTNKFSWNATQEINWSVINAFIDVQTSPDGDVYAIQNISSEQSTPKYYVYLHNTTSNVWTLTDSTFQAKAVRFDRFGNIFYLSADNCVQNQEKISLVCGVKDFEVTVDKKIYGLNDGTGILPTDTLNGNWNTAASDTTYSYKALSGYKGLTLLKDQPIFIAANGQVDSQYGSEKLISISAGIDGSLWALQEENDVKDYKLLKWQTVAQKWYKVDGAKGINLSVYNEISVAIVDSNGLLSLSSQVGKQNVADYVISNPGKPTIMTQPILSSNQINWLKSAIPQHNYQNLKLLSTVVPGIFTSEDIYASFQNLQNIFVIYKSSYSNIVGAFFKGPIVRSQSTGQSTTHCPTAVLSVSVEAVLESFTTDTDNSSNVYLFNQELTTGVFNQQAEFNFNLDCEGDSNPNRTKDYLTSKNPDYFAEFLTGSSVQADQGKMILTCVQIDIYQGEY